MTMSVSKVVFHLLILCQLQMIILTEVVKRSGVYITGSDQTLSVPMEIGNQMRMKRGLMDLFGIPAQAESEKNKEARNKRSATNFLKDIYQFSSNKTKLQKLTDLHNFDVNVEDFENIDDSDMVISIAARNTKNHGIQINNKAKRLWFDCSTVSKKSIIFKAELKLYRSVEVNQGPVMIAVHRIGSERNSNNERDMFPVDDVVTNETDGWVTLDVTAAVIHWVNKTKDNRGFYVSATYFDEKTNRVKLQHVGIVGFDREPERQPFMIVYSNTNGHRARSAFDYQPTSEKLTFPKVISPPAEPQLPGCSKKSLYINFRELNFDWVIAPDGFDTNYCSGTCQYPEILDYPTTNNALFRSQVHRKNPDKVPLPCCAPDVMSSVQYFIELGKGTYVLRTFEDIKVDTCGCF